MEREKRILVCEDDPVQLAILTAVLRQAGYETTAARTPAEGLKGLLSGPVDAVVADVHLGRGSAFELQAELQRSGRDVPVLLISGLVTPYLKEKAIREGARGLIEKPCDIPSIVRIVRGLVERLPILAPCPGILGRLDQPIRRAGILRPSPRADVRPRSNAGLLAMTLLVAIAAAARLIGLF